MSELTREKWMLESEGTDPFETLVGGSLPCRSINRKTDKFPPKVSSRELNPYFKNGGSGLPPDAIYISSGSEFKKPAEEEEATGESKKNKVQENLNKLMAAKMKAELRGDTRTAAEYDNKLQKLRSTEAVVERERENLDSIKRFRMEEKSDPNYYDRQMALHITKNGHGSGGHSEVRSGQKRAGMDVERMMLEERKNKALKNHLRMEKIQEQCELCMDSERCDSKLIVAVGNFAYLCLPSQDALDHMHCLIVPIQHLASSLHCDESTWEEFRNFKKSLLQMGREMGREAVFLETVIRPEDPNHTLIDCVFLPKNTRTDPRGYFRKALLECDEEWSQHRHIIDTSEKGGLRKAIPKNFPFAYVDFRLDQGYAHVIEDVRQMGANLMRELTLDLLGLSRHEWKRVQESITPSVIAAFRTAYDSFDWTKLLHSAE